MGNHASCLSFKKETEYDRHNWRHDRPSFGERNQQQQQVTEQQAIAMLIEQQITRSYSQTNRSSTTRTALSKQSLPRSASARSRNVVDTLVQPQQLLNKEKKTVLPESLETHKFVLVHGGGFGAWCWYKTIALLQDAGCVAIAVDLSGAGIETTNPNEIPNMEQYVKPLSEFLENLPGHEKVILVAHSLGGACISYAMEHYPQKIAKAIFVAASMIKNEQASIDVFSAEFAASNQLATNIQGFVYANGKHSPPTSMELDKNRMKDTFFNHTNSKDVALAILSIRPIPFAPFAEKISLSDEKYGSIQRFFIQTMDDLVYPSAIQEKIINMNPPEQVMKLKGSDHCPFFSKPQSLHSLLLEIAQLNRKTA